jgi:hypothetical protein
VEQQERGGNEKAAGAADDRQTERDRPDEHGEIL